MQTRTTLVVLTVAVLSLPMTASVQAQAIVVTFTDAANVFAVFDTTDGCVTTSVVVSAISRSFYALHNPPGPLPDPLPSAFVAFEKSDDCSFTTLMSGWGVASIPDGSFTVDHRLTSATLNATINVYDRVANRNLDLTIAVAWTGTGQLESFAYRRHLLRFRTFKQDYRHTSTAREAIATGIVSDGISNLTPEPSVRATIENGAGGSVGLDLHR